MAAHQAHDPMLRTRALLIEAGVDPAELDALEREADERVQAAVEFAEADPEPDVSELAAGMYAPGSLEQFERMRPGSPLDEVELVFEGGLGR